MKITTLRTTAGGDDCPDNWTCPGIHRLDEHPDRLYVITKREDDPAVLQAFASRMAPGEALGYMPASLLPEL